MVNLQDEILNENAVLWLHVYTWLKTHHLCQDFTDPVFIGAFNRTKKHLLFFVSIKLPFSLPPPSFFYHNIKLYVGNCSLPLTEHCHLGASFISQAAFLKEALRSMCRLLDLTGLEFGTSCPLTCTQPKSHLMLDLSSNMKPQTECVKPSRPASSRLQWRSLPTVPAQTT